MTPEKQTVLAAVPAQGEIKYNDLRTALVSSGNGGALAQFHDMRRKGELAVRTASENGVLVLYVARP